MRSPSLPPRWLQWPLALLLALGGLLFLHALPQILAQRHVAAGERWLLLLSGFGLGYLPLRWALSMTLLPRNLPRWHLLEALALDGLVAGGGVWVACQIWQQQRAAAWLLLLVLPLYALLRLPSLVSRFRLA